MKEKWMEYPQIKKKESGFFWIVIIILFVCVVIFWLFLSDNEFKANWVCVEKASEYEIYQKNYYLGYYHIDFKTKLVTKDDTYNVHNRFVRELIWKESKTGMYSVPGESIYSLAFIKRVSVEEIAHVKQHYHNCIAANKEKKLIENYWRKREQ